MLFEGVVAPWPSAPISHVLERERQMYEYVYTCWTKCGHSNSDIQDLPEIGPRGAPGPPGRPATLISNVAGRGVARGPRRVLRK